MAELRRKETEKPSILVLADNSQSMLLHGDSTQLPRSLNQQINQISQRLSQNYTPALFQFGGQLEKDRDSLDFKASSTNMALALRESADLYFGRNVGAVILLSDGIYNEGIRPDAVSDRLPFPVYALGVGDTVPPADLILKEVLHNRIAYRGNVFPVRVLVRAQGLRGKACEVSLFRGDEKLASQSRKIDDDAFFTEFTFQPEAKGKGLQAYRAVISPVEGEYSLENNRSRFFIEVLENKRQVVVLARAPHPDIGAIKRALDGDNFNLEVFTLDQYQKNPAAFEEAFRASEILLLHDLPTAAQPLGNLRQEVASQNKPLWLIAAGNTSLKEATTWQLGFEPSGNSKGSVQATARWNENFSLFALDDAQGKRFAQFPPLYAPYQKLSLARGTEVLFRQNLGQVQTQRPMMFFTRQGQSKKAVLLGGGSWRWAMFNYVLDDNRETYRNWVRKTIRYLASRNDKRLFRIVDLPEFFPENEDVTIKAELYNPSYELLEGGEAELEFTGPDDKTFTYSFVEQGRFYEANLGRLKPGIYQFTASTSIAGEKRTVSGQFLVKAQKKELAQPVARFEVMRRLASSTGGAFAPWSQADRVLDRIEAREDIQTVSYLKKDYRELMRESWLLGVLVLLLGTEWALRKYLGHL